MRLCVRALVCVSVWVCWCWWGICAVCCDLLHSCARFYKCNAPHYGTPPWSLFLAHAYAKFRIFCPANMSQCVCGGYLCECYRMCVCVEELSHKYSVRSHISFLRFVCAPLFQSGVDIRVGIIWLPFSFFRPFPFPFTILPFSASVSVSVSGIRWIWNFY